MDHISMLFSQDNHQYDTKFRLLFFNKPDHYNGVELLLYLPNGEFQDIKLQVVSAVVYPTTFVHEVLPVCSGARRVAVFWMQSFYRDSEIHQIVSDLRTTLSILRSQHDIDSLPLALAMANLERKFIER